MIKKTELMGENENLLIEMEIDQPSCLNYDKIIQ